MNAIVEIVSILLHIVYTIVTNTMSTLVLIFSDIIKIFGIMTSGQNSFFNFIIILFIFSLLMLGMFNFGWGSLKTVAVGVVILAVLVILFIMLI